MRKNLIKWSGVFAFLALSLNSKADFTSHSLPVQTIAYCTDDVVTKLAGDAKFTELIELISNAKTKINALSLSDKKLFKKHAEESNISGLSQLYMQCGLDYKKVAEEKMTLLRILNSKYELAKRNDLMDIIKEASAKAKIPFSACIMEAIIGSLACEKYADTPDYNECIFGVTALWITCIVFLD